MKKKHHDIACRRHLLLEKITAQRIEIEGISLQLQKTLALADAGIRAVHFIHRHPALIVSGIAMLLALYRGDLHLVVKQVWRLLSLYSTTDYLSRYYQARGTIPE
jgi:hypothetical protein